MIVTHCKKRTILHRAQKKGTRAGASNLLLRDSGKDFILGGRPIVNLALPGMGCSVEM